MFVCPLLKYMYVTNNVNIRANGCELFKSSLKIDANKLLIG